MSLVLGTLRTAALLGRLGDFRGGLVLGTLRTPALLGGLGDVRGGGGLVLGTLRTAALLGGLGDVSGVREEEVGELLGEVVGATVELRDVGRDVINEIFDLFHDGDGEEWWGGVSHTQ